MSVLSLFFCLLTITTTIKAESSKGRSRRHGSSKCEDECTYNIEMPNFCDYASDLWDDASTPVAERNNIGMAKYLTREHTLKAVELAVTGKVYKLAFKATNSMPAYGPRNWFTALRHPAEVLGVVSDYYVHDENNNRECGAGIGYLDQRLMTSSNGNMGTQFDGLGHIFYVNGEFGDQRNYLFFNGFRGSEIMRNQGLDYIGVEELPALVTRAILLDVAGYLGVDVLPVTFRIDTGVVQDVLEYQGMTVDDIEVGDVILFFTGWAETHWLTDVDGYYYSREPGITLDTVWNIFGPKKVLVLGADTGSVEYLLAGTSSFPLHLHWIVCHGGFLLENLNLIEWVTDARNGEVAYQGGFYYTPAQIEGGVGGLGTPIVIV